MKTRASIAGHPLHAMLVPVPIGALVTAVVLDILHVSMDGGGWLTGAFVAIIIAAGGALVAMVPGFVDYWFSVPRTSRAWDTATTHMIAGSVLGVLLVASAIVHGFAVRDGETALIWTGIGLDVAAVLLVGLQGWLGAELRTRHRIGVLTPQEADERDTGIDASGKTGPATSGGRRV